MAEWFYAYLPTRRGCVSGVLLWVLSSVLFLAAVACAVFVALFRDEGSPYLDWGARVTWLALCVALALVLRASLL